MYALYLHNIVIVINDFFLFNYKQDTTSKKISVSTCDKHNDVAEGLYEVTFYDRTIYRKEFCPVCVTENEQKVYFGHGGYICAEFTMVCRDCVPNLMR